MPIWIFYSAVGSEILYLARTTSSKEKIQELIPTLIHRQSCQSTQLNYLSNILKLLKDSQIMQNHSFNYFARSNLKCGFLLAKYLLICYFFFFWLLLIIFVLFILLIFLYCIVFISLFSYVLLLIFLKHVCICRCIYICICICIYIYINICICICIYTYVHVYIRLRFYSFRAMWDTQTFLVAPA